jgi:mRNA interferase RelE/StbE
MTQSERPLYQVEIKREAQRTIKRLPRPLIRRITAAIEGLTVEPRPHGCKKLVGLDNHYRVRVGDWRISYAVYDDRLLILVVEVSPRGDAYRNL